MNNRLVNECENDSLRFVGLQAMRWALRKKNKMKKNLNAPSLQPLGWCEKVNIYNNFMLITNMNDI